MIRRPPRSTRTDTLFPYTTLFRSAFHQLRDGGGVAVAIDAADPARRVEPDRFDILHGSEACRLEHAAHCRLAAGAAAAGEFDGEQGAFEEIGGDLHRERDDAVAVYRVVDHQPVEFGHRRPCESRGRIYPRDRALPFYPLLRDRRHRERVEGEASPTRLHPAIEIRRHQLE